MNNTIKLACLQRLDYIPIVSTVSSLIHIFNRCVLGTKGSSVYCIYLRSKTIKYHLLNLIPLYNIINCIFFERFQKREQARIAAYAAQMSLHSRPIPPIAGAQGSIIDAIDILKHHQFSDIKTPYPLDDKDFVAYEYHDKKHVVHQQSLEGCSSGVSCMLALDHGKTLDHHRLTTRTASAANKIQEDLENSGLRVKKVPLEDLEDVYGHLSLWYLDLHLTRTGPACVRIRSQNANIAHWVVVDSINSQEHTVSIRDPWHGWRIDIQEDAFLDLWRRPWNILKPSGNPDFIVQVLN